jgi:hypothetical protein
MIKKIQFFMLDSYFFMTNTHTFTRTFFSIAAIFTLLTPLASAQSVFAAGLEPFNADKSNADTLRFHYTVNPGETKQDDAKVSNPTNLPVNVEVLGRDGEITSDGAFTVISNSLENQKAGRWIQLDQTKYTVPATTAIKVPFKVSVPDGTVPGEYYAGLSVIETGDANAQSSGNVTVKTRVAVKMFITVRGDLQANTDVKNLNIIDPSDSDFNIERAKYGAIGRENMYVRYEAENTGNLFLRLATKYKITLPDGSVSEGESNQDIAPKLGSRKFYIETKQPFKVGKTKVDLSYEAKPINTPETPGDVKNGTLKGNLTDELNITQDQIDKFAQSRIETNKQADDVAKNGPRDPIIIKEQVKNNTTYLLVGVIIALLAGIIALQVYNGMKKNKDSNKTM